MIPLLQIHFSIISLGRRTKTSCIISIFILGIHNMQDYRLILERKSIEIDSSYLSIKHFKKSYVHKVCSVTVLLRYHWHPKNHIFKIYNLVSFDKGILTQISYLWTHPIAKTQNVSIIPKSFLTSLNVFHISLKGTTNLFSVIRN